MTDELEHFEKKYRATISESQHCYASTKKISKDRKSQDVDVEYGVQIDMSKRDFAHLVHMEKSFYEAMACSDPQVGYYARDIVLNYEHEQRIRTANPAVKLAYEKYQTLLKLAESHYEI